MSTAPAENPPRDGRTLRRAWCAFVVFFAFSSNAWINAFAQAGDAVAIGLGAGLTVVSIAYWLIARPVVNWRRLPWLPLVYVAWAGLSILWSQWPGATAVTWLLLAATAFLGLFVAAMLTWREIIGVLATALKWLLGLSLVFEIWVWFFVGYPLLPGFGVAYRQLDPFAYWSHDNLFVMEFRIQGIVGNANLLASACVVALIVFAVRLAARPRHRLLEVVWIAIALFLLVRAASATAYVSLAAVAVVLGAAMLMRTTSRPGERNRYYALFAGLGVLLGLAFVLFPNAFFAILGRSSDFTGREQIWMAVLDRAAQHPVFGNGFSTPWLPWDPAFSHWILDHYKAVMQAHNMWLDIFLQLGIVGIVLVAGVYLTFLWRAWFFAVDRPRWDLDATRPYTPLSLLPTLVATVLLVQGFTESGPLMMWGWMLVVLFTFKIKQAPIIGHGTAEGRATDTGTHEDRRLQARTVGF